MKEREKEEKKRKTEIEEVVFSEDVAIPTEERLPSSSSSVDADEFRGTSHQDDRNMIPIPTIAIQADRYGVSNRAAAAIITPALVDYGIITSDDQNNVIDHHKYWRAGLQLRRRDLKKVATDNEVEIRALYFDRRKDLTLVKEKKGRKWYDTRKEEDHDVLIGEPGTFYLSHIELEHGIATAIADGLYKMPLKKWELRRRSLQLEPTAQL